MFFCSFPCFTSSWSLFEGTSTHFQGYILICSLSAKSVRIYPGIPQDPFSCPYWNNVSIMGRRVPIPASPRSNQGSKLEVAQPQLLQHPWNNWRYRKIMGKSVVFAMATVFCWWQILYISLPTSKALIWCCFFQMEGTMLMNVLCESGRVIFLVKLGMVQLVFCFLFGWKSRWPEICDNHLALLYELLFACWIFNLQILKR